MMVMKSLISARGCLFQCARAVGRDVEDEEFEKCSLPTQELDIYSILVHFHYTHNTANFFGIEYLRYFY